ncbi:hypothetical protein LPJ56_006895, partial [Coemansia sp. RSA 2599]
FASSMVVSAAPVPQKIGNAIGVAYNNLIEIDFNPATIDWNQINWSSVFAAEEQKQQQQRQIVSSQASSAPVAAFTPTPETSETTKEAPVAPSPVPAPVPAPAPAPEPTPAPAPAATTSEPEPTSSAAPENVPEQNNGGSSGNSLLWGLNYSPYNTDGSCPDVNAVAGQLAKVAAVTKNIRL